MKHKGSDQLYQYQADVSTNPMNAECLAARVGGALWNVL